MRDRADINARINGRDYTFAVQEDDELGFGYVVAQRGGCIWSGTCPDFLEAFDAALQLFTDIREGREP